MTDTTEAQQPQQSFEGFRVLDERDAWGNMVVETPSTFQLPIQTDDPNIALQTAYSVSEQIRVNRDKDPIYSDFLTTDQNFMNTVRLYYKDKEPESINKDWYSDDFMLVDKYVSDMRWRDNNTVSMARSLSYTSGGSMSDEQKRRSAYLFYVWDSLPDFHETGGAGMDGLASNVWRAFADPVNILGFGLAKGATKLLGREVLKSQTKKLAAEVGLSAGVDGLISGGFAYADQVDRVNLDMQTEINTNAIATATAIGSLGAGGFALSGNLATKIIPQPIKNFSQKQTDKLTEKVRRASLVLPRYLTTHAGLGREAQNVTTRFTGTIDANKREVRDRASVLELELEKHYGKSYDEIMSDDQLLDEVDAFIAYKLDETGPNTLSGSRTGLTDDQRLLESIPKGETPVGLAAPKTATLMKGTIEETIDPNIARNILSQNEDLDQAVTKFVTSTSKLRKKLIDEGIVDENITSIFMQRGNKHLTRTWEAFLRPDDNLKRLNDPKNKQQLDDAKEYIANQLNKSDSVSENNFNVHSPEVRDIIEMLAQGRLFESKQIVRDLGKNLPENKKLSDDILKFLEDDPTATSKEMISLLSESGNFNSKKITGEQFSKAALTARANIPKEIQNVLGIVKNPLERVIQTNMNLSSLYHYAKFSNELTYELIRTKQIDRGLVAGKGQVLDQSLKDLGVTRSDIDTNKTLRQAVEDGDIADKDAFATVLKENDKYREQSFQQLAAQVDQGKIFNPLGAITFHKGFYEGLNQLMYGARFEKSDGAFGTLQELIHRVNIVPQAMQTVYSTVTTARNITGGLLQFIANGGAITTKQDLAYLKNTYLPIWLEILKSRAQKKPTINASRKLREKGYTLEQIDDVIEEMNELYAQKITDADMLADSTNMWKAQTETPFFKQIDQIYSAGTNSISIRAVDNLFRRFYASGDELFKVIHFSQRKRFWKDKIGFSRSDAVSKAGEETRDRFPMYSMTPRGFKAARLLGVGTFTSFTTEITRNTKNIYRDIGKDFFEARKMIREGKVGTPTTKEIITSTGKTTVTRTVRDNLKIKQGMALQADAAKRFGMITAVMGAAAQGVSVVENAFSDQDKKVKDAYRSILPEYLQADQLITTDVDKETGNMRVVNASFVNPFTPLGQLLPGTMIRANEKMSQGMSFGEAITDSFYDSAGQSFGTYLQPGLGSGPVIKGIFAALEGNDAQRERAYEELINNYKPGTMRELRKFFNRVYDQPREARDIGPLDTKKQRGLDQLYSNFGVPLLNINLQANVEFKFKVLASDYKKARRSFTSTLTDKGIGKKGRKDIDLQDLQLLGMGTLNPKYKIILPTALEDYTKDYLKANNEKFITERNLYATMLSYRTILDRQAGLSKDQIYDKLNALLKLPSINIDKSTRVELVNAVAYNKQPRFKPFKMTNESFKGFRLKVKSQKYISDEETEVFVQQLKNNFEKIGQEFEGRSLGMSIREE